MNKGRTERETDTLSVMRPWETQEKQAGGKTIRQTFKDRRTISQSLKQAV